MWGGVHHHLSDTAKVLTDAAAAIVAVGTMARILPSVAALFTIIWLAIRIWESDTVRGFTKRQLTGRRDVE